MSPARKVLLCLRSKKSMVTSPSSTKKVSSPASAGIDRRVAIRRAPQADCQPIAHAAGRTKTHHLAEHMLGVADFAQSSHVLLIDTIYDLTPWLSVGAKYGLRSGSLKDAKINGRWFSSRAQLYSVRLDLPLVKEEDAVAEGRTLSATEAKDLRTGALLGVYRHLGEHFKVGVGYNFTDYSDDLTLETAVERHEQCVPWGAGQGATRRMSPLFRRAAKPPCAPGDALLRRQRPHPPGEAEKKHNSQSSNTFFTFYSGQLPLLG